MKIQVGGRKSKAVELIEGKSFSKIRNDSQVKRNMETKHQALLELQKYTNTASHASELYAETTEISGYHQGFSVIDKAVPEKNSN